MIKLREFEPQDYEALVEIDHAIYPEYRYSVESWRYDDEHFDRTKYLLKRYVASSEGRSSAGRNTTIVRTCSTQEVQDHGGSPPEAPGEGDRLEAIRPTDGGA
jgi:hypothetical protein